MSVETSINNFVDNVEKLYEIGPDGSDGFGSEFQKIKYFTASLKRKPSFASNAGENEDNKKKNRYKDILPYDHTRVRLPISLDDESDYINASLIKGPDPGQTYIASQGPLPHTVNDFWKMLWTLNVRTIIMVCNLLEMGKKKCERYWADEENEVEQFDDITVTLESEKNCSGFQQRHIIAQRGQEKRKLTQLQLTTWPDHGVPKTRREILNMIATSRKIQDYSMDPKFPMCVHCSAGCGRTGAVLVIDYFRNLLIRKKLPPKITVFDVVIEMRKQRPAIVQTKDQYEFVHLAISEMFTKYLQDHSGKEPTSQLSKSLLSTNYENVTLPQSTKSSPNSKPADPKRQNYQNVEIRDKGESRNVLTPGTRSSPPPKVSSRPFGQTRPVSSYIPPTQQTHLQSPPVAGLRKHSLASVAPMKPAVQKKPSNPREYGNVPAPGSPHRNENKHNLPTAPAPSTKPKPRPRIGNSAISLTDFTAKQGKEDQGQNASKPFKFSSEISVQSTSPKLHAQSPSGDHPKPPPKPSLDKSKPCIESIQKRKERLWSTTTQNEPSNLQKTKPSITASAIDLRLINDQAPINPRFVSRTLSMEKGNSNEPVKFNQKKWHDKPPKNDDQNSHTNYNRGKVDGYQFATGEPNRTKVRPPILPKKSIRRSTSPTKTSSTSSSISPPEQKKIPPTAVKKLSAECLTSYVSTSPDENKTKQPIPLPLTFKKCDSAKPILKEHDKKYVNVKNTTPTSTSRTEVQNKSSKEDKQGKSHVNIQNPGKVLKSEHRDVSPATNNTNLYSKINSSPVSESQYDFLKRSFKSSGKVDDEEYVKDDTPRNSTMRETRSKSEGEPNRWNNAKLTDFPRPYNRNRSSVSSITTNVFETNPTPKESSSTKTEPISDLHGLVSDKDAKLAAGVPKPSPPIKPQRTFKKGKSPYISKPPEQNVDVYAMTTKEKRPTSSDSSPPVKHQSPYYSVPSENSNSYSDKAPRGKEVEYAEVASNAPISRPSGLFAQQDRPALTGKDSPNFPHHNAPAIPIRTPDSYVLAEDVHVESNQNDHISMPYEEMNDVRPGNETGRRTSGASSLAGGVKAKTKEMLAKTTNAFSAAKHSLAGSRSAEDDGYNTHSRVPTYKPSPVIYGNQDISYGNRYAARPKGPRPVPQKWSTSHGH